MSAAAARRRKQLAASRSNSGKEEDVVTSRLKEILAQPEQDEATAYEALQLAVSVTRKAVQAGEFSKATDLAASCSLQLLEKQRVSVASQLMGVLLDIFRETHTEETEEWIAKLLQLRDAHQTAMPSITNVQESLRLERLQCDWLRKCVQWSAELGKIRYGHNLLHKALAEQCWKLSTLDTEDPVAVMDYQCDAVQHMALAEDPAGIAAWLKTLPPPTAEETAVGHACPPAVRDALLTRAVLLLVAVQNLRDANTLLKAYMTSIETRPAKVLAASYTNKEDGQAPAHLTFGCMLVRICEKDVRTGPLFSWLIRSFRKELDKLHKPAAVLSYTTKIGKVYFNIQPPPSMLNMVENMMSMMGGGGGGMNPAMMQAALAQMQGGMM